MMAEAQGKVHCLVAAEGEEAVVQLDLLKEAVEEPMVVPDLL